MNNTMKPDHIIARGCGNDVTILFMNSGNRIIEIVNIDRNGLVY